MAIHIAVLIPAYNESREIGNVIGRIKSMGHPVYVVDDGSVDDTARIASEAGAQVIRHPRNSGKGISLKTGLDYLNRRNYDAVVIMDGDAQHDPGDITAFIEAAEANPDVMVIGNRMANTRIMPLDRKLTNRFMSLIISWLCGQRIADSQCGFRLIPRNTLKELSISCKRFEVETELLIRASRAGTRIISVPVKTLYGREISQINPLRDTMRFIAFLIRLPFMK